jgi:hypothetical protein
VTDSIGNFSSAVSESTRVPVGDVNGNGVVSKTDVAAVKAQVAAPVTASNFRNDVTANGIISDTDVSATKAPVDNAALNCLANARFVRSINFGSGGIRPICD